MIDKLDQRVPGGTAFTKEFGKIYALGSEQLAWQGGPKVRWSKSRFYARQGDFSEFGLPVMLHMECEMTASRHHKLEILQTGKRTYGEILEIGKRIFEGEPESWGILRADLTADVPDVPVQWFKEHTYTAAKQVTREIGVVKPTPYMTVRKGQAQTLYAGKKPNQLRIYDKVAEQLERYVRMCNRVKGQDKREQIETALEGLDARLVGEQFDDSFIPTELPTFFEFSGYMQDQVLTRVERQIAGKDLEKVNLLRVEHLQRAEYIKPFEKMRFFEESDLNLRIEDWGFTDWNVGMALRQRAMADGLNEMRKWMQKHQGKNFTRTWKKYAPFYALRSNVVGITAHQLQKSFADSTYRQVRREAA